MLQPEQLTQLQLELECIGVEAGNTLVRLPGPDADDIARCLVIRRADGYAVYFRHDLPSGLRATLAALPPALAFEDHATVQRLLAKYAPYGEVVCFKSYVFPAEVAPSPSPQVVRLPQPNRPGWTMFGIVVGDRLVSACESARENERCAEAWVWTLAEFRRRGYARQVTAAWSYALQQGGKRPFYSHKVGNLSSEAVARSLGLTLFQTVVAYN
ncbi:MAG: GNAT family N-acetyltransferase [Anaerolineae bacterium]|nr:GNAT family N-acetyltransferase [Anaerolineae bacterium]